jgi:peptide deformylase
MVEIVNKENKVLRQIAKPVPIREIASPKIQKMLRDMSEVLASQDDGVALAAPQIGQSLRIFVMSGSMLQKFIRQKEAASSAKESKGLPKDFVFINPEMIKLSKETKMMEEGCLSIRYLYGKTRRSAKATVRAYNEKGELFERGGSGLIAQIFQHEVDHLNGVLFTDKAIDIEDLPPPKKK